MLVVIGTSLAAVIYLNSAGSSLCLYATVPLRTERVLLTINAAGVLSLTCVPSAAVTTPTRNGSDILSALDLPVVPNKPGDLAPTSAA